MTIHDSLHLNSYNASERLPDGNIRLRSGVLEAEFEPSLDLRSGTFNTLVSRKRVMLNEGITQYFAEKFYGISQTRLAPHYRFAKNVIRDELVPFIGERTIAQAYFGGDLDSLAIALQRKGVDLDEFACALDLAEESEIKAHIKLSEIFGKAQ